jgi:signal peptidase I
MNENEFVTDGKTSKSSSHEFLREMLRTGLIVLLIVLPIRLFIAQPFIVSGASMQPNFSTGDYLIIDQVSYYFENAQRGEVVVFRYPNNPKKFFIKRIIGLPGETVQVTSAEVIIFNKENPDGFTLEEPYLSPDNIYSEEETTIDLNVDEYFVLGDNRGSSSDSRIWGALPEDLLVGRAYARLLPVSSVGLHPGYETALTTP